MATTLDLIATKKIQFIAAKNGRTEAHVETYFGDFVVGTYWKNENAGEGQDAFRFSVYENGVFNTYSHPTEKGCQLYLTREAVKLGFIAIPEDNSHLDEINQAIAAKIAAAREENAWEPRIGDFVILPNGHIERCSARSDYGMQTSQGGSFSITTSGNASFSGGLNRSRLLAYFKDTGQTKKGSFWFFSHGITGAGRGVDCFLDCRIYRIEPFEMDEAEARAHPLAVRAAEVWGEGSADHTRRISDLMLGTA